MMHADGIITGVSDFELSKQCKDLDYEERLVVKLIYEKFVK